MKFVYLFIFKILFLGLYFPIHSNGIERGLDLSLGIGRTLPVGKIGGHRPSSEWINRIGLSYQWPKFLHAFSINTGTILTRKGMQIDPAIQESWVFTSAEFQTSLLYSNTLWNFPISLGLSFIPVYNFAFDIQNRFGSFPANEELHHILIDIGIFAQIELGPLGVRSFYHQSLRNALTFENTKLNHYGVELLIPLYRKRGPSL